jgi:hypothetical protein
VAPTFHCHPRNGPPHVTDQQTRVHIPGPTSRQPDKWPRCVDMEAMKAVVWRPRLEPDADISLRPDLVAAPNIGGTGEPPGSRPVDASPATPPSNSQRHFWWRARSKPHGLDMPASEACRRRHGEWTPRAEGCHSDSLGRYFQSHSHDCTRPPGLRKCRLCQLG